MAWHFDLLLTHANKTQTESENVICQKKITYFLDGQQAKSFTCELQLSCGVAEHCADPPMFTLRILLMAKCEMILPSYYICFSSCASHLIRCRLPVNEIKAQCLFLSVPV